MLSHLLCVLISHLANLALASVIAPHSLERFYYRLQSPGQELTIDLTDIPTVHLSSPAQNFANPRGDCRPTSPTAATTEIAA